MLPRLHHLTRQHHPSHFTIKPLFLLTFHLTPRSNTMATTLSIGDYVRVIRGIHRGYHGHITAFTPSRKSADVDLEGRGSTRVLVRLLVLAPVPAANAAPVEPPVADVPNPPDNDAVYVADEHPDFPDASLNLFMSNHATILPSMDELCSLFAEHGFGQRSAVIAYFGSRLRLAEDRVVANHASIPPADADFVILDDDE
jgi:hypothetical protein